MEAGNVAHSLEGKVRTEDIKLKELAPFSKMLLSEAVRKGLQKTGFVYPTAIQAMSIPMGKSGLDLLVQSKSGTGKTLIFCTIILEAYRMDLPEPQSLIVVPTREIAIQIEMVLNQVGSCCSNFRAVSVIGGLDVAEDRKRLQSAKAVVGTPGRLLHLIQNNVLNTSKMRLLVLDEADKMYTQSFRQDLRRIQNALPAKKQTISCSATFCDGLDKELAKIMRNPLLISTEERATLLVGIKQFAYEIPEQKTSILEMQSKLEGLRVIFGRVAFKQCLIFAGSQSRANSYCNYLEKEGWPCELISGAQDQKTRLAMFHKFREFKSRIIITTDLMSRGVDSEHVNLVINLELPNDMVTYLHRIGRAGRFGSHGIAINFVASEKDRCTLTRLISRIGNGMNVLKFLQRQIAQTEQEYDIWDFSNLEKDQNYFGQFGCEPLAPLASQDHSSFSDTQENKENQTDNFINTSSSIDTNTFRVDSKDSALNIQENLLERPECNHLILSPSHKLTIDSRQGSSQQLPSSNTIDDASSIAADSLRSSQQDISRYQSVLMQKAAIPTLFEFLVDPNSCESQMDAKEGETKKKPPIDLFDDYKNAVLTNSNNSLKETEETGLEPHVSNKITAYKSMLIDQPVQNNLAENKHDIYSDYANFNAEEYSSSLSQETGSNEIDKATFILSVATPSGMQDSIEEFVNTTATASDLKNSQSISESLEVSEVKHFTSPAHNQPNNTIPDVVPPCQRMSYNLKQIHNLTVNVGAQIEIPPHQQSHSDSPALNDSVLRSREEDPSPTITASNSLNSRSNSERGGSSGFNERNTTSASSGIVTSDTEPERYVQNGYYSSSETGTGSSYEIDPELLFPYPDSCKESGGDDEDEENDVEIEEEDEYEENDDDIEDEYKDQENDDEIEEEDEMGNGAEVEDEEYDQDEVEENYYDEEENDSESNIKTVEIDSEVATSTKKRTEDSVSKGKDSVEVTNKTKHSKTQGKKTSSEKAKQTQNDTQWSQYNFYGSEYEAAHALWMEIYWTQLGQIQEYVQMTRDVGKSENKK
ncbi:probable ATP-dependent RNA helicase DDX20 [Rhagoletis pomonella]|uniref:probable ATP-dependent RNA helicase DDX20 n=1 Tax=Rhagoletis pomonella TaxID=28610 RepID=UPI001780B966|nr:probable ATP-dependent RNA helicase DDX20 [Rhagoletis pomonella]